MLLTGEYAVLDGAKALAIPTKLGQKMMVKKNRGSDLIWESLTPEGEVWFSSTIALFDFSPIKTTDFEISKNITNLLKNAVRLNSEFLDKWNGFKIETQVEFPLDWGLGSSSTLIHNVAEWADINSLMLAFKCTNGSGYDVACAGAEKPIVYQSTEDSVSYTQKDWNPSFTKNFYFVHLGKKQSSADGIKDYIKKVKNKKAFVASITTITEQILECTSLSQFEELIDQHEEIVAKAMGYTPIKAEQFSEYWGSVKSLGAWGGDFILVTSTKSLEETKKYFNNKGLKTVIPYADMAFYP